jgi:hypothetical protein
VVDIGDVIACKDVRIGDTVRMLERSQDVEITYTLRVAEIRQSDLAPANWFMYSPDNEEVYVNTKLSVVYLVNRPETSPEVEAIVKALGVSYDVASDYHSKGVRVHV